MRRSSSASLFAPILPIVYKDFSVFFQCTESLVILNYLLACPRGVHAGLKRALGILEQSRVE